MCARNSETENPQMRQFQTQETVNHGFVNPPRKLECVMKFPCYARQPGCQLHKLVLFLSEKWLWQIPDSVARCANDNRSSDSQRCRAKADLRRTLAKPHRFTVAHCPRNHEVESAIQHSAL